MIDVCCVCGNPVTLWTKNECKLDVPWGTFILQYHKACESDQTKKDIIEKVKELALAHKP